jgi:hypothetical protein
MIRETGHRMHIFYKQLSSGRSLEEAGNLFDFVRDECVQAKSRKPKSCSNCD